MSASVPAKYVDHTNGQDLYAPSRPLPAWLLSFMLHFAVVLSGALLFRAGSLTGAGDSLGERGGEIVLFSNTKGDEKQYLTETDIGGGGDSETSNDAAASAANAASQEEAAPSISGVSLPTAVAGSAAAGTTTPNASGATSAIGRLGPKGGRSGGAATSVFGAIGEGHRFIYVIDRSSSMANKTLAAAKRELMTSLSHLGDIHQFGIIFYNLNQTAFGGGDGSGVRMYFAKRENRLLAEKFINGTPAQGATDHLPALKMALDARPDVIFFLTDADDPVLTEVELQKIRGWNVGATIHAIQFGYGPKQSTDNFLEQLTSENGGMYRYVDVTQLQSGK